MRPITLIVIHCSASPNGESLFRGAPGGPPIVTPVTVIDDWHAKRGFHRDPAARARFNSQLAAIGYHFVVYTNGCTVTGRALDEIGAHVTGYNQKSIGVCLVGTDKFTPAQWVTLRDLIKSLQATFPDAKVVGHRDLSPDQNQNGLVEKFEWLKICPGFSVADWLADGMNPIATAMLEV